MTVAVEIGAWSRRLLDVEGLSRDEIGRILDLAVEMRTRSRTPDRSLLENEVVGLAFYEVSTRTRVLRACGEGARRHDRRPLGRRQQRREGRVARRHAAHARADRVTTLVLRHGSSGAAHLAVRTTGLRVVNAGDGTHAHPSQALLDALTLREAFGTLEESASSSSATSSSRVARSNIHCLLTMGARVRVAGPRPAGSRASRTGPVSRWPRRSPTPSTEPMR